MKKRIPGPPLPVQGPPGRDDGGIAITYGHNAGIRKVLMQFNVAAERLILDPDAAEHVAAQLLTQAKLARGRVQ